MFRNFQREREAIWMSEKAYEIKRMLNKYTVRI
jgi:hypothetical protein